MIEQQGKVLSAAGNRVSVRLGASSGCTACDAGKGCGAGVFGRLLQRKPVEMDFENTVGATEGQAVVVGLPEILFLSLVLRLYLYPLLAGLLGAVAGHLLASQMQLAAGWIDLSALASAIIAAAWVLRLNRSRPVEFPQKVAVHLLRTVECKVSES